MPKGNLIYKYDGQNEKLGKYRPFLHLYIIHSIVLFSSFEDWSLRLRSILVKLS